ncbi:MAG TPA: hypothetical protein VM754_08970 [Actinomycetota bacterium]|nr:hypothetical protein [Actinomycetota bacterium]
MNSQPSEAAPEPERKNWNVDFRLQVYKRRDGDWSWRIISVHNGKNLVPEGYRNKGEMLELLSRLFPGAEVHEQQP